MSVYILIPARYHSSRLPGKLLLSIGNKSILQHVYERALEAEADEVMIAADDQRIVDTARDFKATVYLTNTSHQSGTERIGELIEKLNLMEKDIIVNLQGDEPFISPAVINQLIHNLEKKPAIGVATLCEPLSCVEDVFNPNVCKVVRDQSGYALYFSRAPIPWSRDTFSEKEKYFSKNMTYYRHIGIYAFRVSSLKQYLAQEASPLERIEVLEQLRFLWYGIRIHVDIAKESIGPGIDTEEDLQRARKYVDLK